MLVGRERVVDDLTLADLVALADGTLTGARRDALEARVRASPEASALLREQRRALAATRAFAPDTPPRLHAAVRMEARAGRRRWRVSRAALAACAALGVVTVVALTRDDGVSVPTVAAVAERAALDMRAPPSNGTLLQRSFAGVTFPDWGRQFGWHASGARRDRVEGRATDTVYYHHHGHLIGYTVLSGPSIGLPTEGRRVSRNGVAVQVYDDGPRTVAVFERGNRLCVLSGAVLADETLVKLASWRADGHVSF
jgi:hypothetical protein